VLAVFAFGFVDLFAGLFFFGDAAFTFRVVLAFRFRAAPIAAPDRPPMTVPTTGTPKAVPATAPATAPPKVLPAVPIPVSAAFSLSLSSILSPSVRLMHLFDCSLVFAFPPSAFSALRRYPH
jgi:hypothetical protein